MVYHVALFGRALNFFLLLVAAGVPVFACAGQSTFAFRYERSFNNNKYYQPEMELAHKFDNKVILNALQKRRKTESTEEEGYVNQETTVGIAYSIPLGAEKQYTLLPKIDYRWKGREEIARPSLKLYYKLNESWGLGARYRYEYVTHNKDGEHESRIGRYDLWLDYNVTPNLKLGYNPNYHEVSGSAGGAFPNGKYTKLDHWFNAYYKLGPSNTVGVVYKLKQSNSEDAKWNADERDNLVQLVYLHRF